MYSDAVRNFIRNFLKVPSSENFLISVLIQYKVFPNDFLKIGQMIKDEPKSAWKTNKNFISNFVDSSQYWKFLKIFGNPQVISSKKINFLYKKTYNKEIIFDFSGFQRVSEVFNKLYGVFVDFRDFQSISELSWEFRGVLVDFREF